MSVTRQSELIGLARASYYQPVGETAEELRLLRLLDEQ
jgi:putative transposase